MSEGIVSAEYDREIIAGRGLAVPPFNLSQVLSDAARRWPDAIWISDRGSNLTYGESDVLAGRMAATLDAAGVSSGNRVAVLIPNHPAFAVAVWGTWRAGAICTAMHPAYAEPTLAAQIADAGPACLVTIDEPELLARAQRLVENRRVKLIVLPSSGPMDGAGLASTPLAARLAPSDDLALLQYTGGTTGGVKAAMLTHRSITENLGQLCIALPDLRPGEECLLAVAPFAHITGFQLLCQSAYLGAKVVLETRFDPDRTAQLCLDERISFFTCVPTVMEGLNRSAVAQAGDWSALKYVISGGAPLPGSTRSRFEAMTGCALLGGYGLSEASPAVLLGHGVDGAPAESVGPPLPGTRVAISATDNPDRFLPIGETGEIRVAGPQLMNGYWRKEEDSAEALWGGMLRTGDIGHIDAGGRIHVSSRLKDLIIASGYNIYPSRVEDAIMTHDAIADVAVIGVPHDYRGETVKAVAVLKAGRTLTIEELQDWLKPRLSPMEMVKILEIRDALPKSPAGKTLKIALREPVAA